MTEVFLSVNGHRSTDPNDHPPYSSRKANLIGAVKSAKATVVMAQEMTPPMRSDLTKACGYKWFAKGNVAMGWLPEVWSLEHDNGYDLKTGDDDRWCVVVVLKHIATGFEIKVASVHLTNLEGPDGGDGWRMGQAGELVAGVVNLDVLGGDFNDDGPVFDYFEDRAGLITLKKKAQTFENISLASTHHYGPARKGNPIDSILTLKDRTVVRAWYVRTDTQSDFPNASDHQFLAAEIQI